MSAIAGIDQALWDIKGKVLNAPVWQLMGGLVRDKIKAYSWVGGDRPAEVIDGIRQLRNIGFDTFKLNGCEEMGVIDNSRAVDRAVNTVAQSVKPSATRLSLVWISTAASARQWPKC